MQFLKEVLAALYNYFTVKRLLLCALALTALLLLFIPLRDYFDKVMVIAVLSKIGQQPLWLRNILFGLVYLIVALAFYNVYREQKYAPKRSLVFLLAGFVMVYIAVLLSKRYTFYGFVPSNTPWLAYSNILGLAALGIIFYSVRKRSNNATVINGPAVQPNYSAGFAHPFEADEPVKNKEADLFGRVSFAERIASKIKSTTGNTEAISVGITGTWGSGKTSFLNLVKTFLVGECTIFQFNPWKNENAESMVKSFFEELADAVEIPGNKPIRKKIMEYAAIIADLEPNLYTKTANKVAELLNKKEDEYQDLYNNINAYIAALNKKLVVFIDDIDRLDKKEIIQVLKIMRKTAGFSNITYVAAYDKNYVLEAVKELNPYNHATFLEKIFLFEFQLPIFESATIRQQIKSRLIKTLSNEKQKEANGLFFPEKDIHTAIDLTSITGINFTDELIQTEREAIRLVNSFLFEIENVKDEVDFLDFYLLQIIKFKFPKVYQVLQKKARFFTTKQNDYTKLVLKDKDGRPLANKPDDDLSYLQEYLQENAAALEVAEENQQSIILLVKELLYRELNIHHTGPNYLVNDRCFRHEVNFHKYFALRLLTTDLSETVFNKSCNKNYIYFQSDVDEWLKEGKAKSVLNHLTNFIKVTNKNEFENRMRALLTYVVLDLYRLYHYKSEWTKENVVDFMSWPVYNTGNKINFYKNIADYKEFVNDIVFSNFSYFKSKEKSDLFYKWVTKFPGGNAAYTNAEMLALCRRVFNEYCSEKNDDSPVDETFFQLLSNCKTIRQDGLLFFSDDIIRYLKNYILLFSPGIYTGLFISEPGGGIIKLRTHLLQQVFSPESIQSFTIGVAYPPDAALMELNALLNRFTQLSLLDVGGTFTLQHIKPVNWPVLNLIDEALAL